MGTRYAETEKSGNSGEVNGRRFYRAATSSERSGGPATARQADISSILLIDLSAPSRRLSSTVISGARFTMQR